LRKTTPIMSLRIIARARKSYYSFGTGCHRRAAGASGVLCGRADACRYQAKEQGGMVDKLDNENCPQKET